MRQKISFPYLELKTCRVEGTTQLKRQGALVFLFPSPSNNNNNRGWKRGQTAVPCAGAHSWDSAETKAVGSGPEGPRRQREASDMRAVVRC